MNIQILKRVLDNQNGQIFFQDIDVFGNNIKVANITDNQNITLSFLSFGLIFNTKNQFETFMRDNFKFQDMTGIKDLFKSTRKILKKMDITLQAIDDGVGDQTQFFQIQLSELLTELTDLFVVLESGDLNKLFTISKYHTLQPDDNGQQKPEMVRILAQNFQPITQTRPATELEIQKLENKVKIQVQNNNPLPIFDKFPGDQLQKLGRIVKWLNRFIRSQPPELFGLIKGLADAKCVRESGVFINDFVNIIKDYYERRRGDLYTDGFLKGTDKFQEYLKKDAFFKMKYPHTFYSKIEENPWITWDLAAITKNGNVGEDPDFQLQKFTDIIFAFNSYVLVEIAEISTFIWEDNIEVAPDQILNAFAEMVDKYPKTFQKMFKQIDQVANQNTRKKDLQLSADLQAAFIAKFQDVNLSVVQRRAEKQRFIVQKMFPEVVNEYIERIQTIDNTKNSYEAIGLNLIWKYLEQQTKNQNMPADKGEWRKINMSPISVLFFRKNRIMNLLQAENPNDYFEKTVFQNTWLQMQNHSQILAASGSNFNQILKILKYWTLILNYLLFKNVGSRNYFRDTSKFHILKLMGFTCEELIQKETRRKQIKNSTIRQSWNIDYVSMDFLSCLIIKFQQQRLLSLEVIYKNKEIDIFDPSENFLYNKIYTKESYNLDKIKEFVEKISQPVFKDLEVTSALSKDVPADQKFKNRAFTDEINRAIAEQTRFKNRIPEGRTALEARRMFGMPYMTSIKKMTELIFKEVREKLIQKKLIGDKEDLPFPEDSLFQKLKKNPYLWWSKMHEDFKVADNDENLLNNSLQNQFIIFDSSVANINKRDYFFKDQMPVLQFGKGVLQQDFFNVYQGGDWEISENQNRELYIVLDKFHKDNLQKLEEISPEIALVFYQVVVKTPIFNSVITTSNNLGVELTGFNYYTINLKTTSNSPQFNILGEVIERLLAWEADDYDPGETPEKKNDLDKQAALVEAGINPDDDDSVIYDKVLQAVEEEQQIRDELKQQQEQEAPAEEEEKRPEADLQKVQNSTNFPQLSWKPFQKIQNWRQSLIVSVSTTHIQNKTVQKIYKDIGMRFDDKDGYLFTGQKQIDRLLQEPEQIQDEEAEEEKQPQKKRKNEQKDPVWEEVDKGGGRFVLTKQVPKRRLFKPYKSQVHQILYDEQYHETEKVMQSAQGLSCGKLVCHYIQQKILNPHIEKSSDFIGLITKHLAINNQGEDAQLYTAMSNEDLASNILKMLNQNNSSDIVMLMYATVEDFKGKSNYVMIDIIQAPNFSMLLYNTDNQNFKLHSLIQSFYVSFQVRAEMYKQISFFVVVESDHFYLTNLNMTTSFLKFTNQFQINNQSKKLTKILGKVKTSKNLGSKESGELAKISQNTFLRRQIPGQIQAIQSSRLYDYERKFEDNILAAIFQDYVQIAQQNLQGIPNVSSKLVNLELQIQKNYIDSQKYTRRQFPAVISEQKRQILTRPKATGQFDIESTSETDKIMVPFIICLYIDFPEQTIDLKFNKNSKQVKVSKRYIEKCFENDEKDKIPCVGAFVFFLQQFQNEVWTEIKSQFDFDNPKDRELFISQFQYIKECIQVVLYGWNSSGFDLPIITPYIQFIDPQILPIIGDVGRIKFLKYGIYQFQDLFLTVGCSLKDAGFSFKIAQDLKKQDFDIAKFQTLQLLKENRDIIVDYCFQDLKATRAINVAIVKEFNDLIPKLEEYLFNYLNIKDEIRIKQIQKLNFSNLDSSFVPTTVSALSELLFQTQRGFFTYLMTKYNKKSNTDREYDWIYLGTADEKQHIREKNSYHGGLTFVANYAPLYGGFYIDQNSLYPSEIASVTKPSSYVETINIIQSFEFGRVSYKDQQKFLDPEFYKPTNLYGVYSYEFQQGAFVPFCTKVENTNYQFRVFKAPSTQDKNSFQQIWGIEIIEALKQKALKSIIIGQTHVYKTHPIHEDLYGAIIKFLYEQRLVAKKEDKDAKQMFIKIVMNSSYGKKGQRNFKQTFIFSPDQWEIFLQQQLLKNEGILDNFFKTIEKIEILQTSLDTKSGLLNLMGDAERAEFFDQQESCKAGKKKIQTFKEFFEAKQNYFQRLDMKNPSIRVTLKEPEYKASDMGSLTFLASFITASARTSMSRAIFKCGGLKNVWYMDTDSLILNHQGFINLKKAGLLDEEKMCHLKNELGGETSFYKFQAFSAKCYTLKYREQKDPGEWKYKTAFKGVKKGCQQKQKGKFVKYHSPQLFKSLKKSGFAFQSADDRCVFQKVNLGSIKRCGRELFSIPKAKSFIETEGNIRFFEGYEDVQQYAGIIQRVKMDKREFQDLEHSVYMFSQSDSVQYEKIAKYMRTKQNQQFQYL